MSCNLAQLSVMVRLGNVYVAEQTETSADMVELTGQAIVGACVSEKLIFYIWFLTAPVQTSLTVHILFNTLPQQAVTFTST